MVQMREDGMAGGPASPEKYRLFLLRLWQQDSDWRGRLLDLASGEACSFAGWPELIATLLKAVVGKETREVKREQ